jgi:AAA ATPase domain
MENPFTPGFGTSPRLVVGRDVVLGEIGRAFGGAFDPHRTTWLSAPRGSGKTVVLNEVQDLARESGWAIIQEDAQSPGSLCGRVASRLTREFLPAKRRRVKGVSLSTPLGGGSLELNDADRDQAELRGILERVLDQNSPPAGVLITVDEIHTAPRDEVAHLGNVIQHMIRQDRPVATVMAGLTQRDDDDLATFLRRCTKPTLHELPTDAVRLGLQQTAALGGGRFTGHALDLAVQVTAGFPYMLQLVGYWAWDHSRNTTIDIDDVRAALPRCEHELIGAITGTALNLSPVDEQYLEAMALDDGPSRTGELAQRIGRNPQHAGVYRRRLLQRGVIIDAGTGLVDFAVPGHRARLRIRSALAAAPPESMDRP